MRAHGDILAQREKIVLAAYELGPLSWEVERLVVACWERWPETFALRGYPQYADCNRVLTKLCACNGPRGRGHIRRVSEGRYEITESGIALARQILPLARRAP